MTTILWYRQDLRVDDQPALCAAIERGGPVVPLYIWSPEDEGSWPTGAASRWWLHRSLASLAASLRKRGSRLIVRSGSAVDELGRVISELGARAVLWSRRYEPAGVAAQRGVEQMLATRRINSKVVNSSLLHDPERLRTKTGGPYQVFTPFWRALQAGEVIGEPLPPPKRIPAPDWWPESIDIERLDLLPEINWSDGIDAAWSPGERGAHRAMKGFLSQAAAYDDSRDRPDEAGTSRLSPHLHFGEISSRRVWHEVIEHEAAENATGPSGGAASYLRQLVWREFAHHLLHHFPQTPQRPLRDQFSRFPWRRSKKDLEAWQHGMTGYPYVDAGMRQLWTTGWMHNRVRMMVASFLVKHLLLDWKHGAAWFWDTLVDADLANNTLGWQWCAGCGADAAPYFRIFNPITQGEKFDPQGLYVRRWIPELGKLPDKFIHKPWDAPPAALREAGVRLGTTYPHPIVEHTAARERALAALASIKERP